MDVNSPALEWLIERLEERLQSGLPTLEPTPEPQDGVLQRARLALTSQRREIEKPQEGLPGISRLRSLRYWREERRRVCAAVDDTLTTLIAEFEHPQRPRLQRDLEALIDLHLPPRCRNLLRMRYDLDVTTDQIAIKLGENKSALRKTTERCLTAFAQVLVELALERGAAEHGLQPDRRGAKI